MTTAASKAEQACGNLVDGGVVTSASEATVDVINPSNGRAFMSIPAGCDFDADRAVVSARRSFEAGSWSKASPSFRKRVMHQIATLIETEATNLDALDAEEMGKPLSTSAYNATAAAQHMRFNAEAIDKVKGEVCSSDKFSFVAQRRVPRGVVAAVVPWNFPTFNSVLKIAPALAAGNCVVVKPSELSSRSAMRLGHLALEAGLPNGVLNIVPGLGKTVGRALALHTDVDMMAFTGSSEVGRQMFQYAGESNMKVVLAECGGKSPHIVFSDGVDLTAAAESIASFILTNQGQICSVGSRLLVQRSIQDEMVEMIGARLQQIVMGDARDPATTFGPLVSEKQCTRVMHYIETAGSEGAELVIGGKRALSDSRGYFVEPTLFRNVSPGSQIAQDEVFGPVLAVIPFSDEAEAIRIANGTRYGLSAYVWTAKLSTGMRMAEAIRSTVFINATSPNGEGAGHAASFEPTGQSGVGVEGGLAGLESYLRRQLVWINHG